MLAQHQTDALCPKPLLAFVSPALLQGGKLPKLDLYRAPDAQEVRRRSRSTRSPRARGLTRARGDRDRVADAAKGLRYLLGTGFAVVLKTVMS